MASSTKLRLIAACRIPPRGSAPQCRQDGTRQVIGPVLSVARPACWDSQSRWCRCMRQGLAIRWCAFACGGVNIGFGSHRGRSGLRLTGGDGMRPGSQAHGITGRLRMRQVSGSGFIAMEPQGRLPDRIQDRAWNRGKLIHPGRTGSCMVCGDLRCNAMSNCAA